MKLRQFNAKGIEHFRNILQECRENPHSEVERHLLEDNTLTEEIVGSAEVMQQVFKTKGEAGKYLHLILKSAFLDEDNLASNVGLWSWLSLFYFDSLCPRNAQGHRKVKAVHHYIYDQRWNYYYRHLLFVSWKVWDITQGQHRLITATKINEIDRVTRYIMNKLSMIRIPCIFEVLDHLYWNETTNKAKKNIAGSEVRRGDLNRLPAVIRQLEITYDLQSLNADQLIELLGDEFIFST